MRSLVFALLLLSGHACKHICSDDAKCEQSLGRPTEKFEKYGKESYALSHSATPYNGDFIRELNFVPNKQSLPTIIFMPGFGAEARDYTWIMKYWASKGSRVIGIDFPKSGFFDPQNHEKNAQQVVKTCRKLQKSRPLTKDHPRRTFKRRKNSILRR